MTDLILRSFNGVAKQKSYGGKSLESNLANTEKAIEKVRYTERIWDRSRSQWMLKFLVCSNADGWLRLRQICAEMTNKRLALTEAKFSYMKNLATARIKRKEMLEEADEDKRLLLEIEAVEKEHGSKEILRMMEGAMKECETLGYMHDSLKEKLGDVTEEQFEKAQTQAHLKRATMQAIRNVKEVGKIKEGNGEYLEQSGISTTELLKDIFIFLEEESQAGVKDTSMLQKFLEDTVEKYEDVGIQRAEWLGFDPNSRIDLTYQ